MKRKNQILMLLLCVCVCFTMLPVSAFAVEDTRKSTVFSESRIGEGSDCTCETDDPDIHATDCPAYVAPESPKCYCEEKCAEDHANVWCDVCGVLGSSACGGGDAGAAVFADSGEAKEVDTWDSFIDALADENVTTIILTDNILSDQPALDNTLIVGSASRDITIDGKNQYTLSLNYAGILLGGNVTFQDISIKMNTAVRNAIIANGHSLTLNNVQSIDTYNISLFCGGVTDYNGGNSDEVSKATSGDHGQITIKGTNNLNGGCIYAGSLSDVGDGAEDQPNDFSSSATVTIADGATGVTAI